MYEAFLCLAVGLRFAGFFFVQEIGPCRFDSGKENKMKKTENETMGMRIKKQRCMLGMTQEDLAVVSYLPKSTISAYENDRIDLKASTVTELASCLKTTPNYLMGFEKLDNPFLEEAMELLGKIKDEKTQEMLLKMIRSLAD